MENIDGLSDALVLSCKPSQIQRKNSNFSSAFILLLLFWNMLPKIPLQSRKYMIQQMLNLSSYDVLISCNSKPNHCFMFMLPHLDEPASSTGTQKQNSIIHSVLHNLPGNFFLRASGIFLRSLRIRKRNL